MNLLEGYIYSVRLPLKFVINFKYLSKFMVVTRSGVLGVSVASHVMEERSIAPVDVPIPRLQMEIAGVVSWNERWNHGDVTFASAQVNVSARQIYLIILHVSTL